MKLTLKIRNSRTESLHTVVGNPRLIIFFAYDMKNAPDLVKKKMIEENAYKHLLICLHGVLPGGVVEVQPFRLKRRIRM